MSWKYLGPSGFVVVIFSKVMQHTHTCTHASTNVCTLRHSKPNSNQTSDNKIRSQKEKEIENLGFWQSESTVYMATHGQPFAHWIMESLFTSAHLKQHINKLIQMWRYSWFYWSLTFTEPCEVMFSNFEIKRFSQFNCQSLTGHCIREFSQQNRAVFAFYTLCLYNEDKLK